MTYEIAHSEEFPFELGRAPRKVRNAYQSTVVQVLRTAPETQDPPRVKKLTGYRNLWRFRVSDEFRLVYRVDRSPDVVTMLMLGHRAKVYERLGAKDDGSPGARIVGRAEDLVEPAPTPVEVGAAIIELAVVETPQSASPDRPLPEALTPELLEEWQVPPDFRDQISLATTEGELLALSGRIPDPVLERVLNALWPPNIEEVIQKPVRIAVQPEDLEDAATGARSLESFLLKLDEEQRAFVSRFERDRPQGPWLVKGGPGSGKSTVALYCVRALVRRSNEYLPGHTPKLRILFTTFTKSLVSASRTLLDALQVEGQAIEVINVDRVALRFLPDDWKQLRIVETSKLKEFALGAISECRSVDAHFAFEPSDADFLLEEVDWVIVGQGLPTLEHYLGADRTGRGRALGPQQRRQCWRLYEVLSQRLRSEGRCLFSERLRKAGEKVSAQYDYVFIDEAQDLKPVAIRFCIGLCRDPANVFLTADSNQSIYGNGISWSTVSSALRFAGKARILRKNYRTTREIWKGIQQLVPDSADADRETLDVETVFSGPWPVFAKYSTNARQSARLNAFLHEALRLERVTPGCAAVLCPTNRGVEQAMAMLDARLNPKAMLSTDVDLSHPGVKVMTMHAAKGLEFPVVAVVGIEAGRMPWAPGEGVDEVEHTNRQRRLLFVACSRAMRRLLLMGSRLNPSPFVSALTDEHWEIEEL